MCESSAKDTCIVETENNDYVISKEEAIRLRKILDKLRTFYILDRVSFHSTEETLTLAKALHGMNTWKVEKDGSVHVENPFGHSRKFKYELLVTHGYDYISAFSRKLKRLTAEEKLFLRRFR